MGITWAEYILNLIIYLLGFLTSSIIIFLQGKITEASNNEQIIMKALLDNHDSKSR